MDRRGPGMARDLTSPRRLAGRRVACETAAMTTFARTLPYQSDFIELCMKLGVLRFGSFRLKSGRDSPYFFNAGLFSSGAAIAAVGRAYSDALVASELTFDMLFGPAYKGIPLVAAAAAALPMILGFLAIEGKAHAAVLGLCQRSRRDGHQGDALVGRAEEHVERHLGGVKGGGIGAPHRCNGRSGIE